MTSNTINTDPSKPKPTLPNDVAQMYALAGVEAAAYKDFSGQRKEHRAMAIRVAENAAMDISRRPVLEAAAAMERVSHGAGTVVRVAPPIVLVSRTSSAAPMPVPSRVGPLPMAEWFVLPSERDRERLREERVTNAAVAVYSLAGGAGKSTLTANLGRALCGLGERTLLVDASGRGVLPFYFGAGDQRTGLRTFVSPDVKQSSLQIISANEINATWLESQVKPAMRSAERTIFDLGPTSARLLTEILALCSVLLVPLLPDLNSTLTVGRIAEQLEAMRSSAVQTPAVFYVFNQFDPMAQIDQQAQEIVARTCGNQLLPMSIRRSTEVSEALAQRMTVADLVPESGVTRDYLEVAQWLRCIAPANSASTLQGRWSER